jgi:hypothetical protein
VFITDTTGQIRFINALGEDLLGIDKYTASKKNLQEYLIEFKSVRSTFLKNGSVNEVDVHLHLPNAKQEILPVSLLVPASVQQGHELKELVFIMQVSKPIDLRMDAGKDIKKLQHIIGACNLLGKQSDEKEKKEMIEKIETAAWEVKESMQGKVHALSASKPENYNILDFKELLSKIVEDTGKQLPITATNNYSGHFFGDSQQILELLQTTIQYLIQNDATRLDIEVKEAPYIGVFFLIQVSGDAFSLPSLKTLIESSLNEYKGFLEVFSTDSSSNIIQICLQHVQFELT